MIEILISITIFMLIHISTMATFLVISGVKIKEVSYGAGPTLFKVGKFKFQPIPVNGYVKALDSREGELEEDEKLKALNHQSTLTQFFAPISGCIFVLLLSYLVLGNAAIDSFISAFKEIVLGALNPISFGQELIQGSHEFIKQSSLITVIATIQIKLVAFNLLPLTVFNGGQAVVNLIKMGKPTASWEIKAAQISIFLALGLFVSWAFSITYYVF